MTCCYVTLSLRDVSKHLLAPDLQTITDTIKVQLVHTSQLEVFTGKLGIGYLLELEQPKAITPPKTLVTQNHLGKS